jgi:hypothetical protein
VRYRPQDATSGAGPSSAFLGSHTVDVGNVVGRGRGEVQRAEAGPAMSSTVGIGTGFWEPLQLPLLLPFIPAATAFTKPF